MGHPKTKKFRHVYLIDFPYKFRISATGLTDTSTASLVYEDETVVKWSDPQDYVRSVPSDPAKQGTIEFSSSPHFVGLHPTKRRRFTGGDGDLTITVNNGVEGDTSQTILFTTYESI